MHTLLVKISFQKDNHQNMSHNFLTSKFLSQISQINIKPYKHLASHKFRTSVHIIVFGKLLEQSAAYHNQFHLLHEMSSQDKLCSI